LAVVKRAEGNRRRAGRSDNFRRKSGCFTLIQQRLADLEGTAGRIRKALAQLQT